MNWRKFIMNLQYFVRLQGTLFTYFLICHCQYPLGIAIIYIQFRRWSQRFMWVECPWLQSGTVRLLWNRLCSVTGLPNSLVHHPSTNRISQKWYLNSGMENKRNREKKIKWWKGRIEFNLAVHHEERIRLR